QVASDLRDIGRDAQGVWVTQFRAANLLRLDADLHAQEARAPAKVEAFVGSLRAFAPTLAWRTVAGPGGEPYMLHQRAQTSPIELRTNAVSGLSSPYGGGGPGQVGTATFCQSGVVHTTLTRFGTAGQQPAAMPALPEAVVPVDLSAAPDGRWLAAVAPGNFVQDVSLMTGSAEARQLFLVAPADLPPEGVWRLNETHCLTTAARLEHQFPGEAVAVHFVDAKTLLVQVREPAELHVLRLAADDQPRLAAVLTLDASTSRDTGHDVFHQNTGTGIACASCHGEALDDAHTWDFGAAGLRRTQHLRGGVLLFGHYHWSGDLPDFAALIRDVYEQRMGAKPLHADARDALAQWLTALPLIPAEASETPAISRGRALFESAEVGCSTCHAGPLLRSDQRHDVGTGGPFKVPSLRGVALRLPLMHSGCADSLEERFDPGCGGSAHGNTAQLNSQQIADLTAYLRSL
ncbi:MAG TPA: c-type cytochrome, partial [Polyangiales bacterium]